MYQRALTIREKRLAPKTDWWQIPSTTSANLYKDQGIIAESEPRHKRALAIRQKLFGKDHVAVARVSIIWPCVRAEGHMPKRSLCINKRSPSARGFWVVNISTSRESQQPRQLVRGQLAAEAEPLPSGALAIKEMALGAEHLEVRALSQPGERHHDQGDTPKPNVATKQSSPSRKRPSALATSKVANTANNLAILYADQRRVAEAEDCNKRAIAIRQKVLGENILMPSQVSQPGNAVRSQGPIVKRSNFICGCWTQGEKSWARSSQRGHDLNNLASIYCDQDRLC